MKKLLLLTLAVLVPFAGLVAYGLSRLDTGLPEGPLPAPLSGLPVAPGASAREGIARALGAPGGGQAAPPVAPPPAPPAVAGAAAPIAPPPAPPPAPALPGLAPPPAGSGPVGQLAPSPLDAEAAALVGRPRPGRVLGEEPTLRARPVNRLQSPRVIETVMKNGFPPRVEAAARRLTAHCWVDHQARAPGPVQVIVLAQPLPEGRFDGTRVSWSSWHDPLFMSCVEDAIDIGSFEPGDPLPPAPVVHTLEFGGSAPGR